jgi:fructose-1,6-bisphosphatase/inositol monophosphatase family enzyme
MDDLELVGLLHGAVDAVAAALEATTAWGETGGIAGQHHSDLVADGAALEVLRQVDVGILSEESGTENIDREVVVVVDPLDGSTNASRGIPWYASSFCAVDSEGPRAAVVADLVGGTRFEAVRGGGARRDGEAIAPSACASVGDSLLVLNGYPPHVLGCKQFRILGAAALDLCLLAAGSFDGYVDCSVDGLAPWDYLGAALVCREAGVDVVDHAGRSIVVLDVGARRSLVAAPTSTLLDELSAIRSSFPW